ncbi:MAG: glycosyltransferase family 2 protein [Bacillota bacterium]
MKKLSLVVPCYNEENSVEKTAKDLVEVFADTQIDCELIFVNDGSKDKTREKLERLKEKYSLKIVDHENNRGYGAALKTGITSSENDYIVIVDADGTYPIKDIPNLYAECIKGEYDMVVGARIGKDVKYSQIRRIPKFFLKRWISQIAGQNIPDFNSGMRVIKKEKVYKYLRILPDSFSFTTTITLSMHTNWERVKYIPISYDDRIGTSKIHPIKDTLRFSMLIARTGMYFSPLRLLSLPCSIVFLLFFLSFIFDLISFNLTDKTIIFFSLFLNMTVFALLADMINKRGDK